MTTIETDVQQLEQLVDTPNAAPMLSLYLVTDPSTDAGRNLHAQFSNLAQTLRGQLGSADEQALLNRALADAEGAVETMGNPPRSLAVFASTEPEFLRTVRLPARVASLAFWGSGPYLRPLRAALDEQEPTFVALVDKEQARIFRLALDEIDEVEQFKDLVPGKHRQAGGAWAPAPGMWAPGGWGDRGIERDHELHVQQHVRLAIDAIRSQLGRGTARVILAGPPEVRAMFTALAPKPLRERIVGELHIPLFASPEEVRQAAVATIAAAERRSEDELIQEMAEKEGRGQAIFGAEAVGRAIVDGQAALLVYAGTAEIAGAACAICGTVMVGQGDHAAARCPRCDGTMDPVADLIDLLARRIVAQGGRTEEVRGEAAERLTARGGVGAILRYPVPA